MYRNTIRPCILRLINVWKSQAKMSTTFPPHTPQTENTPMLETKKLKIVSSTVLAYTIRVQSGLIRMYLIDIMI